MAEHQINIGIDARLYGLEHAGLGRYCMNLVDRLVEVKAPIHWTLFVNPRYQTRFAELPSVTTVPTAITHYSLAEQTAFLSLLNRHRLNLLHVPHFNVPLFYHRPFVVTIHDILWHQVRGGAVTTLSPLKYYLKYAGYRLTVNHAVHEAHRIFVPSNFVKADLTRTFTGLKAHKIIVTYEGVNPNPHSISRPAPNSSHPFLLYIGSAYPHKNLTVVLKALKRLLPELPELTLVIVGSRSVFLDRTKAEVEAYGLTKAVTFSGYQTDAAIAELFHRSLCLVHPSKSEGFGLTGLEAMAAGTPVIAAKATALPEIYADAALYFEPNDVEALADRIRQLSSDAALRRSLITQGFARVQQFSWDKMVADTLQGYREAVK